MNPEQLDNYRLGIALIRASLNHDNETVNTIRQQFSSPLGTQVALEMMCGSLVGLLEQYGGDADEILEDLTMRAAMLETKDIGE